jgi:hypothetical protein
VRGHSPDRILWDGDKKQASKVVDTKVFKLNLGDSLDLLDTVCDWPKFVKTQRQGGLRYCKTRSEAIPEG